MNKLLYPRIAASSIKKNRTYYIPYLLSASGMIGMFYIICSLIYDIGLAQLPGSDSLKTIMGFGTIVIALFSAGFLFYVNSFLMKRRKKELGLYNILGMEKRHIGIILFFESLFSFLISFTLGILSGVLFSRLISLLLLKLIYFSSPLTFSVSIIGIVFSFCVFGFIFFLLLLFNFAQLKLNKPIELLKSRNVGEKEPKTKIIMTLLGLISLGVGYWIAITTESPLDALGLFFVAVILVIIGTYLLFTAGSIALLKLLRKNKKYYYKSKHFTSVSGMIYRMKRNAAGLASICILSTMVLITISTTVSLYIGTNDMLEEQYPNDVILSACNLPETEKENIVDLVKQAVKNEGRALQDLRYYSYFLAFAKKEGNSFISTKNYSNANTEFYLQFMTDESFNRYSDSNLQLAEDEIAYYCEDETFENTVDIFGKTFDVNMKFDTNPFKELSYESDLHYCYIIIGGDEQDLAALQAIQNLDNYYYNLYFKISFNLDGTDEEKVECFETVYSAFKTKVNSVAELLDEEDRNCFVRYATSKQEAKTDFYTSYGGLLFLGIFLGTLFLAATVLIIYYKQISEGYEDRIRFEIMQKVGMSRREVWKTIKSQVLKVFFIPIIMTAIHILAAFGMISKLLLVFNLTNTGLFAICTFACLAVFFLFYSAVYALTAKAYYKITT